jgi:hypothetical protein
MFLLKEIEMVLRRNHYVVIEVRICKDDDRGSDDDCGNDDDGNDYGNDEGVNHGFKAQFFLLNNQLTLRGSYTVALYT